MSNPLTSYHLARLLDTHRVNDVKVRIRGQLVPIADVAYESVGDTIVIDLIDGPDLAVALTPGEGWRPVDEEPPA